ncbi:protoporphyrinogen oxidase [Leucobacter sp. Psy1]|uniref:protoporphyrinogen/coproporphyrinogen oxidase n=1 Tax=Leucobacter sp. Psy1 TaxID=2875729 RepID=UPI001CD24682|nr:FAD-dependent oxidoreductase [Leucobacter sp. Psy1]UBH06963.1 protoporphyrinogen oxidase [Leucobacter sp. Psy1]
MTADARLTRSRVVVIGGGVSGLIAARDLALAGVPVDLLEREPNLGGRIAQAEIAGLRIDVGAEAYATRGGTVEELLRELGLASEITTPAPLGSWVVAGDRAMPLPASGAGGVPSDPLSRASFAALGVTGALRAAVEPLLPASVGADSETLADLVRARLGSRVLDRLVRPVSLGVYSTAPERMPIDAIPGLGTAFARRGSLVRAARDLRDSRTAAGGAVSGLQGGMGELVHRLVEELERLGVRIRTEVDVCAIERDGGDWTVRDASGAEQARGGAIVLAVDERTAARLIDPAVEPASGEPERVEVIALVLDDGRLTRAPRGTGALVAEAEGTDLGSPRAHHHDDPIRAKALTHASAKWPVLARRAGQDRQVIRLSYGRTGRVPETEQLDDSAAMHLALSDASRILGVTLHAASVRGMARRIWQVSGPIVSGEGPHVQAPAGVVLAGDWVSGTGLASVIPGARDAARLALRAVSGSDAASTGPITTGGNS